MNEIAKVKNEVKLAQWTEMVRSRNESEHTECEGQQSFFNEAETEYAKKLKNL